MNRTSHFPQTLLDLGSHRLPKLRKSKKNDMLVHNDIYMYVLTYILSNTLITSYHETDK